MQSETLAQEFARLVKEYHEGDDDTKPEAWNLLADFAVDNADAIAAALSDKQAGEVKIKPLEWEGELGTEYAASILGLYSVWEGHYRPPGAHGGIQADNPKQAAQDHLERIIRSALVDVPAVEPVDPDACKNEHGEVIDLEEAVEDLLAAYRASPTSHQTIGYRGDLWTILAECLQARRTHPPLSREGEDSADASFMTLVSRYGDAPTQEGFDQIYRRYLSDCERAATRSGSAIKPIGGDHG